MLIENSCFALDTAPYDEPRTFAVKDHNSSCVSLEWTEPEFPNGIITNYTVSCLRFIHNQAKPTDIVEDKQEYKLCSLGL